MNIRLFSLIMLLSPLTTYAFRITPMNIMLGPQNLSEYVLVENEAQNAQVAIELKATLRQTDEHGTESRPATDELRVFPTQVLLKPGEKRRVKISYNGAIDVSREKSYRLVAEQLEVKDADKKSNSSGINILLKYVAAVYFTPTDSGHQLEVRELKVTGGKKMLVKVENVGSQHIILKNPKLMLEKNGSKVATVEGEELKKMQGENILSGATRVFEIDWKKGSATELKATLIEE